MPNCHTSILLHQQPISKQMTQGEEQEREVTYSKDCALIIEIYMMTNEGLSCALREKI